MYISVFRKIPKFILRNDIHGGVLIMKDGIRNSHRFGEFHPLVTFTYYVLVITFTMFSNSPIFLLTSLIIGLFYASLLDGTKILKSIIPLIIFISVFTTAINALFTHNGETVLLLLGNNRVTLEAVCYGLSLSIMISAVIVWFISFNIIMSSDKIIYIFGKFAPILGLVISMIFRFIPLLKHRFDEIKTGQVCMLRDSDAKGILSKIRIKAKEISILISWSLEASIISSDSMMARGYGLKGRTSFNLFKWKSEDILLMIVLSLLGGVTVLGLILGISQIYFYPAIDFKGFSTYKFFFLLNCAVLQATPAFIDIWGEISWIRLKSKI